MKKIKVYLRTPLSTSDSLYYKNLINFPPEKIEYKTNISSMGLISSQKKFRMFNIFKRIARGIPNFFNFPVLNAHFTNVESDVKLIHCAHCLSKNKNTPWVADFESPWQFWISGKDTSWAKEKFLELVLQKNCKRLLAWTEQAKKEMIEMFPVLKEKVDVLSFAMPEKKFTKKKSKEITLLFSARYFYAKGGIHTLKVMDFLTKKYENVRGIVVSNTPEEIKSQYSTNKKIKLYDLMPQKELFEKVYPASDIFVYPGYSDSFGFGFAEAMSFGLPIVTVEGYARKEIVNEGKTGFIIPTCGSINYFNIGEKEEQIIQKLIENTSNLIENKKLRSTMSKNCIEEIKNGKFSIIERNKKLKRIYEEAMK